MNSQRKYVLPGAALLVLSAASCASTQQQANESPNPLTRQVEQSQERSERAFDRAEKAQAAASEQARKAAAAQTQVQQDEQKLAQDQDIARQEQARAAELQQEAAQERKLADAEAAQSQSAASQALLQQTQASSHGQQLAAGLVTEVRPDEVVVQPPSGSSMSFRVNSNTNVSLAGQKASLRELRAGSHVRVAYQGSSEGPTAASIQAQEPNAQAPAAPPPAQPAAPPPPPDGTQQ